LIPEGQPKYNDLIDIIIQSAKTNIDVQQLDGTTTKDTIVDQEIVWWKTGSVNSNSFARFAFELKEWERMAVEAFTHMSPDRAKIFAHQIINIGTSYRRSIDAKSSESLRDKNNSQSTLIDKINRNKIEKVYTAKGEMKRSMMDAVMGRDAQRDQEND
jgi:hypothetical protein